MRKGTSMVDATSPAGDVAGKREKYPKPSAKFYIEGLHANYPDTNFMEMDDVSFPATSPALDVV